MSTDLDIYRRAEGTQSGITDRRQQADKPKPIGLVPPTICNTVHQDTLRECQRGVAIIMCCHRAGMERQIVVRKGQGRVAQVAKLFWKIDDGNFARELGAVVDFARLHVHTHTYNHRVNPFTADPVNPLHFAILV